MYKSFKKHFFFVGGAVNTVSGGSKADALTHEDRWLHVASSLADSPATANTQLPHHLDILSQSFWKDQHVHFYE